MKKILSSFSLLLISLLPGVQAARAASVEQAAAVSFNNAGQLITGSGSSPLVDSALFTGSFTPFNATLGTLTACTFTFSTTAQMSGTADPQSAADGSLSATLGGGFYLNGLSFNGTGNSMGPATAAPGSPLTASLALEGFTYTFRPQEAGQLYDPAILGVLTGQQNFPLEFRPSGNLVTYANAVDLGISVSGVLRLTYEYTPAPAPPSITGMVRQAGTGDVTLTWSSIAGAKYAVDASTDLGEWNEVANNLTAAAGGAETSWTETAIPATPGRRFYRVRKTN